MTTYRDDHEIKEALRELAEQLSKLVAEAKHERVGCACRITGPCAHHAQMLTHILAAEAQALTAATMVVINY